MRKLWLSLAVLGTTFSPLWLSTASPQGMYCDGTGQCRNLGTEAQHANEAQMQRMQQQQLIESVRRLEDRQQLERLERCGGYRC